MRGEREKSGKRFNDEAMGRVWDDKGTEKDFEILELGNFEILFC
jgi:hypothetical protein